MLEELHFTSTPFFPLGGIGNETEQFCTPKSRGQGDYDSDEERRADILKRASSSSSCVLTSTCSVSLITGSNWGSFSSSYGNTLIMLVSRYDPSLSRTSAISYGTNGVDVWKVKRINKIHSRGQQVGRPSLKISCSRIWM